ncbi:MAG: PAS domain-containing sensor histidine kinase, partial [Gammaproteobacteria bacterium]
MAESGKGELVEGLRQKFASLPSGAWPDAPQSALVLPITLPGHQLPMALLVAAVSPRRALDEPYRYFYDRVGGQIAATLASALASEEERKRADAEAAMRESEQRFAGFMRHLPGLAWIKDLQGRYIFANEATEKAFCSPRESLYGKTDEELFPADTAAQFRENDRRALASPAGLLTEDALEHEDGLLHHSIVSKFPILGCDGQPSFVGGMAIDISERKQMEEVLIEANRRKDEFLAMLAHELRNPLAPIRNAAQVLKLVGPLEPKQEWAREVIERQTQQLMRLVDDLLDVSRLTRGRIILQREPLELSAVINRAVETSRPLVDARRHQLTASLSPEPVRLEGDLARLVQIVANLLNNAAKYTDEGGQIRLEAMREGDEAVIRVRDNGMGLPAELLPHVFDLFTQADRSLDRSQGGLGIGLTLVRRLVEMHDGKVDAKSDGPGRGSEF